MQWTGGGRGGWQVFLARPTGRDIRNSAGRLGPRIDVRGNGGYVVVAPSATTEPYRWADDRSPWHLPLEPAPAWLVELLDPPAPSCAWQPPKRVRGSAYSLAALKGALTRAATAPAGRRNDQLNASAHSLFGLVASGDLDCNLVARGLKEAGVAAGLVDR
jgi:Bifunctional DNA primase/polymerase, N-terminal